MDAQRFDALSRALSEAGTRRGLLGLLSTLPILGGLFALLDLDETDAKGRRKRRRKRHKHGKGRRRTHHRKCQPNSKATTCAGGKCGPVVNNCKKTVDCGSCDCPAPCDTCFICQSGPNTPGTCAPDPEQAGDPCGTPTFCSDGTLFPQGSCDGDGNCVSGIEEPCFPYTQCTGDGTACATTCSSPSDCSDGYFCDDDDHCVPEGEPGDPCNTGEQCSSGFCVNDVCCVSASCPTCQACDLSGDGTCSPVANGADCNDGDACTTGSTCTSGVCGGGTTICTAPPECHVAAGATCSAGVCTYPPAASGTTCGSAACGTCDGEGTCVGCPDGRTCTDTGFCVIACTELGPCNSPCGAFACLPNLSGGPAFVCAGEPAICSTADCADCAAQGLVCVEAACSCPDCQVCATPC